MTSTPQDIQIINDFSQLIEYKTAWNELVAQSPFHTVFQTYEWNKAWWDSFGDQHELMIIIVKNASGLLAIAPLYQSRLSLKPNFLQHLSLKKLQFIGTSNSSDYCDFIYHKNHPDVLQTITQWIVENKYRWDIIDLYNLSDVSLTLDNINTLVKQRKLCTHTEQLYGAPTRVFNNPVEDNKLPNKKSLKRHFNYFKRQGDLAFDSKLPASMAKNELNSFFQQHIKRRALTGSPSQFLDEKEKSFYLNLLSEFGDSEHLLFSRVTLDDTAIAYHLGFNYNQRFIWYKPTFDNQFAKHSPGEVLIKYLLEYSLEEQLEEFDFTIGEEAFKYRYANLTRYNYRLLIFKNRLLYQAYKLMRNSKDLINTIQAKIHEKRTLKLKKNN